jgi:hypothetical protein
VRLTFVRGRPTFPKGPNLTLVSLTASGRNQSEAATQLAEHKRRLEPSHRDGATRGRGGGRNETPLPSDGDDLTAFWP